LLLIPHPLTHDYYPRSIGVMQWVDWRVLLSLLAHLSLLAYAIRGVFRKSLIAYGILFYIGTLSIVSNILFPVGTHMAERLLFMPSLGFCFVLAVLGYQLSKRSKTKGYKALYPGLLILGVITLAFSVKTIARNTAWKNNYILFTNDIYHSPNSAKLRNAVGGELLTQYATLPENQQNAGMLQEAEGHLLEAIKIHPNYKNAYLLLGNCNFYQQEFEMAVNYYQQALGIDPGYQEANDNLFLALREAGEYFGEERNDIGKAMSYLQQAYQINPNDFEINRLLGVAYGVQGNTTQAITFFEKALSVNQENAGTWLNLSSAYFYANRPEKAEEARRKALEIDPNILQERGQ